MDLFHFPRDGERAQQRYRRMGKDRRHLNGKVQPLWEKAEAALEAVGAKECPEQLAQDISNQEVTARECLELFHCPLELI